MEDMCVTFKENAPRYKEPIEPEYPMPYANTYGNQANGTMNVMPVAGQFPSDKERMAMLGANIRMAENEQRHRHHMEENAQKADIKELHEEQKLVRGQCKELEQKSVYQDGDGYLRIQSTIPGRKVVVSDPIFPKRDIRLEKIVSSEPIGEMQALCWDGMTERIYLIGRDCSGRGFAKALTKAGLSIKFGRDKSRQVADMVYEYLSSHQRERYLKLRYGWNKTTGDCGWEFADEADETVNSILNKERWK